MESSDSSRDIASSVFNNINFLSIKRSVRLLLQLDEVVIEDFVKMYSAVMIFLLNILNEASSYELLKKLTDSSIVYIVEEELRFILIRAIAHNTDDINLVLGLSSILEKLDSPDPEGDVGEDVSLVLSILFDKQRSLKKMNFSYMDALDQQRRLTVLQLLLKRNTHGAYCMLALSSDKVICDAVDVITHAGKSKLKGLGQVPPEILDVRLTQPYEELMRKEIFDNLPQSIKDRFQLLKDLRFQFQEEFDTMDQIMESREHNHKSAEALLNLAYKILKKIPSSDQEVVLKDFLHKKFLDENQVHILDVMIKQV